MKMIDFLKNTTFRIAAASVASTLLVVGVSSLAYSASVKEQNCRSYERQLNDLISKQSDSLAEMVGIMYDINTNPFSALVHVNRAAVIASGFSQLKDERNNTTYAFTKTCGAERYSNWRKNTATEKKLNLIDVQLNDLSKLSTI